MDLHLPYPTRQVDLHILDYTFSILEVADAERLLDELIAKGETHADVIDERIPYWAEVWPSALGLSQFLIRNDIAGPQQEVLELGCGLGLPGIVAGKLGAKVTLSDYLEPALDFARSNWALNNPGEVELALLDWRTPRADLAVDLLIASDITYEPRNFPFLPRALRSMCRPGGTILLSDPRRRVARPFFKQLSREGYDLQRFEETVVFQEREIVIDVYLGRYQS